MSRRTLAYLDAVHHLAFLAAHDEAEAGTWSDCGSLLAEICDMSNQPHGEDVSADYLRAAADLLDLAAEEQPHAYGDCGRLASKLRTMAGP